MEPEFITYQKFNDPALAENLAALLDQDGIAYFIAEETTGFDPSLVMSNAEKDFAVKIRQEDFTRANELVSDEERKNTDVVDKGYYLFSFTNDELIDVVIKADEWSVFDVVLARKLLAERGVPVNERYIAELNEKRLINMKKPEPSQGSWIAMGYAFSLLGGVLGFFIGWHLSTYKKTLPNGERVYAYTENDRRHGRIIFYLSFVGLAVAFAYRLAPAFSSNY